MDKNLYEVLGVEKTASAEQIKKAYKKLAQQYHPDMHATASDEVKSIYEEKFKEINNAHEILSNPEKRAEYDTDLAYEEIKKTADYQDSNYETGNSYSKSTTSQNHAQYYAEAYNDWDDEPFSMANELKEIFSETKEKYKQAWQEIRKDEKKFSLKKRHKNINKKFHRDYYPEDGQIVAKIGYGLLSGVAHIGLEFIYQLMKLEHIKEDNFPKFVVRNRKLLATTLAATIILSSAAGQIVDKKEDSQTSSTSQCETIDDEIKPVITLYRKYEIQFGDTLSELAEDTNTSVSDIAIINGISRASFINEGDEIILPYCYNEEDLRFATETITCEEEDHISEIAAKYDTTTDTIRTLNEDAIDEYGDILSKTIIVPNFISREELNAKKDAENYGYTYRP